MASLMIKAKAIKVCLNRFDDETKQSFMELYDKVDAEIDISDESPTELTPSVQ